ncbi:MAG TPA: tetratricopeptide repeat protein [Fimbriimonadaceae bacterium]|nr:tetratricopeptide repeat protein [Fimbriimonadaceae bacterium]
MRLERCAERIQKGDKQLGLYDDAGVASDRLGNHLDAVAWMEKKKALLPSLERSSNEQRDHWYRYYANCGTFWAHEWFSKGHKWEQVGQLRKAIAMITKAIEINPNAHFGREFAQLAVLQWAEEVSNPATKEHLALGDFMGARNPEANKKKMVTGLAGLVRLGAGWESVDLFTALCTVQAESENSIAQLAKDRAMELILAGKKSLDPNVKDQQKMLEDDSSLIMLHEPSKGFVKYEFERLRHQAEAWHNRRTAFMMERLNAGRHPDWDTSFWDGWDDGPPLEVRDQFQSLNSLRTMWTWLGGLAVAGLIVGFVLIRHFRARPQVAKV